MYENQPLSNFYSLFIVFPSKDKHSTLYLFFLEVETDREAI